jgi:hypothetical protein
MVHFSLNTQLLQLIAQKNLKAKKWSLRKNRPFRVNPIQNALREYNRSDVSSSSDEDDENRAAVVARAAARAAERAARRAAQQEAARAAANALQANQDINGDGGVNQIGQEQQQPQQDQQQQQQNCN